MKTSSHTPNPAAEEQAALWAARLDGSSLKGEDQATLYAWLAEDPAHRTLLSSYCQFSADLEEQLPALVSAGATAMPAVKARPRARMGWFAGMMFAAAASLAVLFVMWPAPAGSETREIATAIAHRQTLTLADGTHIDLNANTRLQVEHTANERRVRLASGEAFFIVSKNPSRPFIVETPVGSVRVTGTEFNVRSNVAAEFEVTVAEGSVQVRPDTGGPSVDFALTAGHRLTARADGVKTETLAAHALDDTFAWRQGRAVFNGTRLEEAAAQFARYHGRAIYVEGDAKDKRVSMTLALDDLGDFLESLPRFLGAEVSKEPDGAIRIRFPAATNVTR